MNALCYVNSHDETKHLTNEDYLKNLNIFLWKHGSQTYGFNTFRISRFDVVRLLG